MLVKIMIHARIDRTCGGCGFRIVMANGIPMKKCGKRSEFPMKKCVGARSPSVQALQDLSGVIDAADHLVDAAGGHHVLPTLGLESADPARRGLDLQSDPSAAVAADDIGHPRVSEGPSLGTIVPQVRSQGAQVSADGVLYLAFGRRHPAPLRESPSRSPVRTTRHRGTPMRGCRPLRRSSTRGRPEDTALCACPPGAARPRGSRP